MGKAARNRRRRAEQRGWGGLDGRNPLTLSPHRLESLVPSAFDHIMSTGTDGGRWSLAACWAMGVLAASELDDGADAPWADDPAPAGLAFVGAAGGEPPSDLTGEQLDNMADTWFAGLDAAGANDRIRSFSDIWERLVRHDNPHGHPLHLAFALALADEPLALEPLPDRLMPHQLLAAELDADAAYLPGSSRRVPGARTSQVQLSEEGAAALRPLFDKLASHARAAGLAPDATIGDVLSAAGHDVDGNDGLLEMADAIAQMSRPWAHGFLATDGLLLTTENVHLVAEADAQRWQQAAGAYEHLFRRFDELAGLDPDEDEMLYFDAKIDAAGTLLDELVALVNDGAMLAYHHLLVDVDAHPAADGMREQVCSAAFTELSLEVSSESFRGALADNVRRLAAIRFADQEPGMPAAVDRALAVAETLPNGDRLISEAVGDTQQELAVWVVLVAVWEAAS